jgi:hypothetical protein
MKQFRNSRFWVKEDGHVVKHYPSKVYKDKKGYTNRKVSERWYEMTPTKRDTGYLCFNLQCPSVTTKKYLNISVHKMVAECYLGPCPNGMVVNHKDGNKLNNHYTNLEYCTHHQNMIHAAKMGLYNQYYTASEVKKMRKMYKNGMRFVDIKKHFGSRTDNASIRQICLNIKYQWVV